MNFISSSQNSQPVSSGFRVDISRGQRIGRVSSEWFSRPDDERYLSLTELYDAVKSRADRAKARTVEAGAQTVPMDSATLKVATVETIPEPQWREESTSIASGALTFGARTFTAHGLAVLVKAPWELLDDAQGFGTVLQAALADAFALELDRVGLYGSGVAPADCHAWDQPAQRFSPLAIATASADAQSSSGYGSPASTRSGSEWAVNTTFVFSGSSARASATAAPRKARYSGRSCQRSMPTKGTSASAAVAPAREWYSPTLNPE